MLASLNIWTMALTSREGSCAGSVNRLNSSPRTNRLLWPWPFFVGLNTYRWPDGDAVDTIGRTLLKSPSTAVSHMGFTSARELTVLPHSKKEQPETAGEVAW